jgi:hypothetical protein
VMASHRGQAEVVEYDEDRGSEACGSWGGRSWYDDQSVMISGGNQLEWSDGDM